MADYTQSQLELLAHQEITHAADTATSSVIGTPVDVSTMLSGVAYLWQASIEATANLVAGLDYLEIQTSPDATGNNWASYAKFIPIATQPVTTTFDANEAIGQTVLSVTATTGFTAPGSIIYIKDLTSVATSEWAEVVCATTNDTITVTDGIAVAKVATDDALYNYASKWAVGMDFAGVMRVRAVVQHQGATGADWRVKAVLQCATDFE